MVEGPLRDSQARSSRVRASVSENDGAGAVAGRKAGQPRRGSEAKGGSSRKTEVFGPARPPAAKQKRKKGAAIAALEKRDLFRNGDWSAIEHFTTVRLPMYFPRA